MSTLPCLYCDGPIPASEAERASLCPLCSRPLTVAGRYRLKQLLSKSENDRVYAVAGGVETRTRAEPEQRRCTRPIRRLAG